MPRSLRSVGPRPPVVVLVLLDHRIRSKALRIVDAGPMLHMAFLRGCQILIRMGLHFRLDIIKVWLHVLCIIKFYYRDEFT